MMAPKHGENFSSEERSVKDLTPASGVTRGLKGGHYYVVVLFINHRGVHEVVVLGVVQRISRNLIFDREVICTS